MHTSNKNVTHSLWVEVVVTTTYLKNRSPKSYLENNSPLKVWNGEKPNVEHLEVFGSDAFVHKPKEQKSKPNNKNTLGLLVGYVSKSYKM